VTQRSVRQRTLRDLHGGIRRIAGLTVTASAPMSGPTATTLSCGGDSDPTEFWFNRQLMQGHWAACDHINKEACILQDDEVGRHFADARIRKQCQGCIVNLLSAINRAEKARPRLAAQVVATRRKAARERGGSPAGFVNARRGTGGLSGTRGQDRQNRRYGLCSTEHHRTRRPKHLTSVVPRSVR